MRFLSTLAEAMPDHHKWRLALRELGKNVIGAFEHKFRGSSKVYGAFNNQILNPSVLTEI